MPVIKRITTAYEIVYDYDQKITVDYADLVSIVQTGFTALNFEDSMEVVKNAAKDLELPKPKYNSDIYDLVADLKDSSATAPDLRACMAYTLLGKKIDAIKHLREETDLGLKEAKDAVEMFDEMATHVTLEDIIRAVGFETARRLELHENKRFNERIEYNRSVPGYTS